MATIRIGRSDSKCVECMRSASPSAPGHIINLGYDMKINGTPGCGEPWTAVEIDYYPLTGGFVFENLRGLPLTGFGVEEGSTYPPEGS